MSYTFDATLKELLGQQPSDLARPFRLPSIEPAQTLNVDLSTLSAATDVAIGFGDPVQEIADLNFQSGPDPSVPARLLLYNAAFHLRFFVPVKSVLVLLRPKADSAKFDGKVAYVCGGKRVIFEYDVIRLWKQPVELFLEGGVGSLPLATLCKMPPGKSLEKSLRNVVREIDRRLNLEQDRAQAARLMTAAFILTGMRVPKENVGSIYEGVTIMHESTAYDAMLEEGAIRATHRTLLVLGEELFGKPDRKTEMALAAIQEQDRLERMVASILSVKSWKQLLAVK